MESDRDVRENLKAEPLVCPLSRRIQLEIGRLSYHGRSDLCQTIISNHPLGKIFGDIPVR